MPRSLKVRALRVLVPVLAAILGAFLYHRYSILTSLDRVQADPGDSRFIAFLLEHWNNVLHGAADWRSPPIFWPVRGTLAYSDGLLAMGVVHAALRSGLGVFSAMNAQLILLSLGTFAAAYALFTRGFGLSVWGATFGAYFVAFGWPRFAQLVHVQLQFTPLLPILILLVLECVRDGKRLARKQFAWRACLFVALLAVLLATTLYYAIFLALWLSVVLLLLLLSGRGRRHVALVVRNQAAGLAAAAGLAVLMIGPVVEFYLPLMRQSRGRTWSEVATFLPHWLDFVWMGRENWVWGWLFARWPIEVIHARWPEFRIGVGLVASVAWVAGVAWSVWILGGRRRSDRRLGPIALAIASAAIVQALMLHLPGDHSGWWLVWRLFPGARGVRAVSRLELLLMISMGLWLGFVLDAAIGIRSRPAGVVGGMVLVALVAVEQFGSIRSYSGRQAEALSHRMALAIPPSCKVAFVMATPDLLSSVPVVDEAHFNAQAYLEANPDVAANWKGTAWEHYRQYGRADHRILDPSQAWRHESLMYFAYNYTIPLAAALAHRPVVNGLSGWQPPGWNLFDVLSPLAPERLAAWLHQEGKLPDSVCTVPVRITLEMVPGLMVPDRAAGLWP